MERHYVSRLNPSLSPKELASFIRGRQYRDLWTLTRRSLNAKSSVIITTVICARVLGINDEEMIKDVTQAALIRRGV